MNPIRDTPRLQTSGHASEADRELQRQLRSNTLNPEELSTLGKTSDFKSSLASILAKQNDNETLKILINGIPLELKVSESPITEEGTNSILSQIKDPVYKTELSQHNDVKHYSLKVLDPTKDRSEFNRAEFEFKALKKINDKKLAGEKFTSNEKILWSKAVEEAWGEEDMVILLKQATVQGLADELSKPIISIRISEDGKIGEVASISKAQGLPGSALMKSVDQLCQVLGVDHMYLEDDAAIESPNGNYSLRLFREFTGKNSWYEDTFHYSAYEKNEMNNSLQETQEVTQARLGSQLQRVGNLALSQIKDILNDGNIKKSHTLNEFFEAQADDNKTFSSLISELGKKIMYEQQPLHKEMSMCLTGFLEALNSYSGTDPNLVQLKNDATAILNNKFFSKSYS